MSLGIAFAFPAYDNPPNVGPFTQSGPTLDLIFTGVPTVDSTFVGQSLDLNFLSQQYQLPAQYSVWDNTTGALTAKTFSDIITFTRASAGTFVGSNGLIQTATTNTPRFDYNPTTLVANGFLVEEARTNLVLCSEQIDNAAWSVQRVTVTANVSTAPDGTTSADLTTGTGASGGAMGMFQAVSAAASTAYVISGFFKAGTSTWVILAGFDGSTTPRTWFNLISGTIGSVETGMSNATIQNYGNGWYRCSVVRTTGASATSLRWQMNHSTANETTATSATLTLTMWGAQIERGAFVTSYIPTIPTFVSRASTATYVDSSGLIATAAINVARYQYNPENLTAAPFLLLEAAATNRLLYTEQFDNAVWTKSTVAVTVSANTTVAPDGTTTADTVTANQDTGVFQSIVAVISTTYSQSIFVKAGTATSMMFRDDTGAGRHIVFNPSTGVITATSGTLLNSGSQAFGNGWWRYWFTYVADTTSVRGFIRANSSGSAQTFIVWGAQTETSTGALPTSYIPNVSTVGGAPRSADVSTNASVTREADLVAINTLSPWFNSSQGTLFAQFEASPNTYTAYVDISNGVTAQNSIYIDNDSGLMRSVYYSGSAPVAILSLGAIGTVGTVNKVATSYAVDNFRANRNGGTIVAGTAGALPVGLTQMNIGTDPSGTAVNVINGHIQRITYYPRSMANYELQALTV
jgi:hypothetical protein